MKRAIAGLSAFIIAILYVVTLAYREHRELPDLAGIQAGVHWNGRGYATDWATCWVQCRIIGYPGNDDWSDAVTVDCYGFQQEGEPKEGDAHLYGICCEPESTVVFGGGLMAPRCEPPTCEASPDDSL